MIGRSAAPGDARSRMGRKVLHGGLITALAVALVVAGSGITFALWTSTANVTSQATTAKLSLSAENFTNVSTVFKNHLLSATGSFTVKNETVSSSSTQGNLDISLNTAAGGSTLLKSAIGVAVWGPVASTAVCTPAAVPSGTTNISGTWSTLAPISSTLTAGESKTWCVRSQTPLRDNLASTTGTLSIQPQITATLTVGQWTATAVKQAAQSTQYIYPKWAPSPFSWYQIKNVASSSCVDVEGDVDATGTFVIDFGCKTGTATDTYNQQWSFAAGTGDYFQIASRKASTLRLDTQSATVGASAQTNTPNGSDRQQWQLQTVSGSEYQLVNKQTGLCLDRGGNTPTNNVVYVAAECNGTTAQRFTLTVKETQAPALASISCAPEGSGVTQRVRYSWAAGSPAIGDYLFQANLSGNSWTTIGTAVSGSTSVLIDPVASNALWSAAENSYNIRIRASNDSLTLAATSSLWSGKASSVPGYLACSKPAAAVTGLSCTSLPNGVAYAWSTPAVGQYDFQSRPGSGTWRTIGSAPTGATSATFTGVPPTQLVAGDNSFRVVVTNTSTALTTGITSVWKGIVVVGGAMALQCAQPTAVISGLTCVNTGTTTSSYSVTLSWNQPTFAAYTIQARPTTTGTWSNFGTTAVGVASHTIGTDPTSAFSNGDRSIQIIYGSNVLVSSTLTVGSSGSTRYWRCPTVLPQPASLTCTTDSGFTTYFAWAKADGQEAVISYRVFIGGIQVPSPRRASGWDPVAQFEWQTESAAAYGTGSKTVEVQQSISGGPWSTTGVGTVVIATSAPYLSCGA